MTVLVACEFSGVVRDAFIVAGHDAVSCDLLPSERPGPHVQGDVRPLLRKRWRMVMAFPPCTYLCIMSSVRIYEPGRLSAVYPAAAFFVECLRANAPLVAVENPRMHRWGYAAVGGRENFFIEPWEFGHEKRKRTCFWTRGPVPPLLPTRIMSKREVWVRSFPGWDREAARKARSRTFEGVAAAMAQQWGALL